MDVFEGDYDNFHRMRICVRREIEKNADINDSLNIREKIIDLEEARRTISSTIIQGKLQDGEFYKYKARPELSMGLNTPTKSDLTDESNEKI